MEAICEYRIKKNAQNMFAITVGDNNKTLDRFVVDSIGLKKIMEKYKLNSVLNLKVMNRIGIEDIKGRSSHDLRYNVPYDKFETLKGYWKKGIDDKLIEDCVYGKIGLDRCINTLKAKLESSKSVADVDDKNTNTEVEKIEGVDKDSKSVISEDVEQIEVSGDVDIADDGENGVEDDSEGENFPDELLEEAGDIIENGTDRGNNDEHNSDMDKGTVDLGYDVFDDMEGLVDDKLDAVSSGIGEEIDNNSDTDEVLLDNGESMDAALDDILDDMYSACLDAENDAVDTNESIKLDETGKVFEYNEFNKNVEFNEIGSEGDEDSSDLDDDIEDVLNEDSMENVTNSGDDEDSSDLDDDIEDALNEDSMENILDNSISTDDSVGKTDKIEGVLNEENMENVLDNISR